MFRQHFPLIFEIFGHMDKSATELDDEFGTADVDGTHLPLS
jgi:hypothetical protein